MPTLELELAVSTDLSVRSFVVREAMSALFEIEVTAVSPTPSLRFEALVGERASLRIFDSARGILRAWTGICAALTHGRAEASGLSTYVIRLAPTLWLASLSRRSRAFVGQRAPEIAAAVLGGFGVAARFQIDPGAHPPLDLRIQFEETDYAFLQRILEEAGLSFHFEAPPDGGGTTLVVTDAPETRTPRAALLPFLAVEGQSIDVDHVTAVRLARRLRPGLQVRQGFDFRRPALALEARATAAKTPGAEGDVEALLEQYRFAPGSFLVGVGDAGGDTPAADARGAYRDVEAAGARGAARAIEAEDHRRRAVAYHASCLDLAPGVVFSISGHPRQDLDPAHRLLVTKAVIAGTHARIDGCSGEAAFAASPYRPARITPKPRMRGVYTATVASLIPGQEIDTDEHGRVRVQLHWDPAHTVSCWARVGQAWAGAGYGTASIPRAGEEVLIAFHDGDPDLPLVVGRVHNGLERVPYALPEHKARSTWRTRSTPDKGGANEIMLDDRQGEELFYVQAERDLQKEVTHDEVEHAGRDRRIDVTGALRLQAKGRIILRAEKSVIIESGEAAAKGTPAVRINCRVDDDPFALEPPLPPARNVDFAGVSRLAQQTSAGLAALQTCARFGVAIRFAPGSAAGFDAARGAVLLPALATPAVQVVALVRAAVHAEWHHDARSVELRRGYLDPADAEALELQEHTEAIARSLAAARELAAHGADVSQLDLPMSDEHQAERRRSDKLEVIGRGLADGSVTSADGRPLLAPRTPVEASR